jgi:hypothetical protein
VADSSPGTSLIDVMQSDERFADRARTICFAVFSVLSAT